GITRATGGAVGANAAATVVGAAVVHIGAGGWRLDRDADQRSGPVEHGQGGAGDEEPAAARRGVTWRSVAAVSASGHPIGPFFIVAADVRERSDRRFGEAGRAPIPPPSGGRGGARVSDEASRDERGGGSASCGAARGGQDRGTGWGLDRQG